MGNLHIHRPSLVEINDQTEQQPITFQETDLGSFKPVKNGQIESLSENIDEGNATISSTQIDAYPDLWARLLLFEDALYQSTHQMHKSAYQEWCGFMALFALALNRDLRLFRAEELDLADEGIKHPFVRGMKYMQPLHPPLQSMQPGDAPTPWTYLCLFFLEGQVIGLTSPRTLICPAAEYRIQNPNITWVDSRSRRLISPIGHLRENEYRDLLCWLHMAYEELKLKLGSALTHPGKRNTSLGDLWMRLARELMDHLEYHGQDAQIKQVLRQARQSYADTEEQLRLFSQNMGRQIEITAQSPLTADPVTHTHRFRMRGIYAPLEKVVSPPSVRPEQSPVRIQNSDNTILKPATVLLLDPNIAKTLNQNPSQIIVFKTYSLASIDFEHMENNQSMLHGQHLEGAVWKTPADFFTDTLYYLEEDESSGNTSCMPGGMMPASVKNLRLHGQPIAPVLPLKEDVLKLLSPKDLQACLNFSQNGDQVTVHLSLPLNGNVRHTISKTYTEQNLQAISSAPSIDIWPNFRLPDMTYLTYFSSAGQIEQSFFAHPVLGDATQLEYIRYNLDGICIEQSFRGKQEIQPQIQDPSINFEICRTREYPEAFYCYQQQLDSPQKKYIGLIAVQSVPQLQIDKQKSIQIGVDLGTSSTNVYMQNQRGHYQPVIFEDPSQSLFHTVTHSGLLMHYEEFLPKSAGDFKERAPLLTLFKIKYKEPDEQKLEAILHGHVNFIDNYDAFDVRNKGLASNLKWSQDTKKYLPPFLEQLCLQAAAKALQQGAGRVELSFSYPSAFSIQDRSGFKRAIEQSIQRLQKFYPQIALKDHSSRQTGGKGNPYLMRENVAATYFFASGAAGPPPKFHQGVVILDIGGGTTDISIIEGKENTFRYLGSVKYAGRDIFLESLLHHADQLHLLGAGLGNLPAGQMGRSRSEEESWVYAQLDAKIKGQESTLMEGLAMAPEQIQPMIHQMAIGMAGLFYYLGSVIQHLRKTGQYQSSEALPRMYIGGNGAKIFHWFNYGKYEQGSVYDVLFEAAFLHQALPTNAYAAESQIELYPTPVSEELGSKPEVAYGLVMNREHLTLGEISPHYQTVPVAGEAFMLEGAAATTTDAIEPLAKEDIKYLVTESFNGQELRSFLEIVNSCARTLDMRPVNIDALVRNVTGDLQSHFNEVQQRIRHNPGFEETLRDEGALFIQELKLLLNYL